MMKPGPGREEMWAEVERELRRFVRVYDGQAEWLWSPATVAFMRAVRPKLKRLGGRLGPALTDDTAGPEEACRGG